MVAKLPSLFPAVLVVSHPSPQFRAAVPATPNVPVAAPVVAYMLKISFKPNPAGIEAYARAKVLSRIRELQARSDKTFTLEIAGQTYHLRYELSDAGVVTIFTQDGQNIGSAVRPNLQLNVGQFLLPVAESLSLDQVDGGYNPDVFQTPVYEFYENGLSPEIGAAIMKKIESTGFLTLLGIN